MHTHRKGDDDMKTAALYIRVSTDDQLEFSPDAQKRALLQYAKQNDYIVSSDSIFIDEGISGRKAEKRPAFMSMIARAKTKPKPFDAILVHKFDRFSRSREDSIVYKSLLRKDCGIQVISITEHMEDDKFAVILEAMLEAMAEYYSLNLSEEVKKGMTEKALRGQYQADAPIGYKLIDKKLVVDEETAPIIKLIFDKWVNEHMPQFSIARYLNLAGYKTKKGNSWENRTVRYVLQNPVYCGYTRWNVGRSNLRTAIAGSKDMIIAKGEHEPIISKEMYDKGMEMMKSEYKPSKSRSAGAVSHWLIGITKCSSCGASLVNSNSGFQCHRYSHGQCTTSHYISKPKMERAVISVLEEIKTSDVITYALKQKTEDTVDESALVELALDKAKQKFERCKAAYLNGIDSIEEYKVNKEVLEREIQTLTDKLNSKDMTTDIEEDHSDEMRQRITSVIDILNSDGFTMEQKTTAMRAICEKIVYDKKSENIDVYLVY